MINLSSKNLVRQTLKKDSRKSTWSGPPNYDSNAILVEPIKNRSDAEKVRAYDKLYDYLT